jgi:hypothetical protein
VTCYASHNKIFFNLVYKSNRYGIAIHGRGGAKWYPKKNAAHECFDQLPACEIIYKKEEYKYDYQNNNKRTNILCQSVYHAKTK